jgi:hypothetical protein
MRHLAVVVLIAGVGTSLIALLWGPAWEHPHLGGMVLLDALVIAWGRQFPDQLVRMYFVLIVRGPALVNLIVGITLVFAAYFGIAWALPELLAVAVALLYLSRRRRRLWLGFKLAWTRRRLRVVRDEDENG